MNEGLNIGRLQEEIASRLLASGADLVGFADISGLMPSRNEKLRSAISIGISYAPEIVRKLDSEIVAFDRRLLDTKKRMERLLTISDGCLKQCSLTVWIPPISKNLPGLSGDFSHKMAATRAGLGWVGKNSLLVSPEFGCGLCLGTVLTNAAFVAGKPVTESRCGNCNECVKACPYGAIKGARWYPGIERDNLLDAFLCSSKREEYIPRLGFKHPCGLCIKACPVRKRHKEKRKVL